MRSQSVAVTNSSIDPVCAGSSISVKFTAINGNGNPRHYKTTSVFEVFLAISNTATPISLGTVSDLQIIGNANTTVNSFSLPFVIPAGTAAGTTYKVFVRSAAPNYTESTYTSNASPVFTVNSAAIPGSILGSTTVCSGTNSTTLTLTGYTGATIQWQSSTDNSSFINIPGQNTASLIVTNLTATKYYRAAVGNGACPANNTPSAAISVIATVAGTTAPNQTICMGTAPAPITLSGNIGNVVKWQKSVTANFSSPIDIITNATTLSEALAGNVNTTTYFRAVVQNGTCGVGYSAATTIQIGGTSTWDGTSWSPAAPTSLNTAIIAGNYSATSSISACSLLVTNNAVVTIPAGFDLTLNGALTVDPGSSVIFENNAHLLQVSDVANSGNITVNRNSSMLKRLDYTLWSSPVAGQNLLAFSPMTSVLPTSRFYSYNIETNLFNSILAPAAVNFTVGKGYLIRMPNNHPTTPTIWNGTFTGVPTNGTVTLPLENIAANKRLNLIGNPYPSPISTVAFTAANAAQITGALYFWRKTNGNGSPTYCSWTKAGASGTFVSNNEAQVFNPNNIIETGQGFFVEAKAAGTTVTFTNAMRAAVHGNQFFRASQALTANTQNEESHRLWLNISNSEDAFCQTAIGYFEEATNDLDEGLDGKFFNDGITELYSVLADEKLVIQARALPFETSDIVPLGYKVAATGNYQISIDHVDGLFAEGQPIYLRDNLTGIVSDITSQPYAFTSDAGIFDNRFEVLYEQQQLGIENPQAAAAPMLISNNGTSISIAGRNTIIADVAVFDSRGSLIKHITGINASELNFETGATNQLLIVKITTDDHKIITRKILN